MLRKTLMFATVLILLCLVLVTPLFLGRETSLAAIPMLQIDHAEEETRIYVQGAVETSRYPFITIYVEDLSGSDWSTTDTSYNTIGIMTTVKDDETTYFLLNITLMRGEDLYEYGCIVEIDEDQDGETISVYLPDRDDPITASEDAFPYRDVIVEEAA